MHVIMSYSNWALAKILRYSIAQPFCKTQPSNNPKAEYYSALSYLVQCSSVCRRRTQAHQTWCSGQSLAMMLIWMDPEVLLIATKLRVLLSFSLHYRFSLSPHFSRQTLSETCEYTFIHYFPIIWVTSPNQFSITLPQNMDVCQSICAYLFRFFKCLQK